MSEPTVAGFGFDTSGVDPDMRDLDETLARIEDTGATFAELSLCGFDLIAAGRVLPERRRRLEEICARRRLRYTVHGALTVNFMDEAHIQLHKAVCRAMLELCDAVGAEVMVHHPGRIAAQPAPIRERLHALERTALAEMGDLAAERGVRIAVENLFVEDTRRYTADPLRLAQEIAAVDHPQVVGTLDFSHAYLMASLCGIDFEQAVRALAPYVGHLHVHDSFGRTPTIAEFHSWSERIAFGMGDLHLPMGWGDIPWPSILPGLPLRAGTALIVELPRRYWSELEAVAATAARFVDLINDGGPGSAA